MFVRVFDKARQRYYKSIVYGGINVGYHRRYIVVNPYTDRFELVDELDKSSGELTPLVEIIQSDRDGWVTYENAMLLKFKKYCILHGKMMNVKFLFGYRDVCENYEFLTALLEKGAVPSAEAGVPLRTLPDMDEWNYIRTQEDADMFMKAFAGFHDATLEKVVYEENHHVSKATAVFDNRCWYGIAELCFEGVQAINIRPPQANYTREIFEGTLLVRDEAVLWADWYMKEEDLSYDGSYIKALNLKWRKIG